MNMPRRILLGILGVTLLLIALAMAEDSYDWPTYALGAAGAVLCWLCLHFAFSPPQPKH